jgi:salicylate hydroxylase
MSPPAEFSRPPTQNFDIAVVGGGIGGLVLTLSLLSRGIATTLYEAAPKFGEIGAGVSFGPNATRAMELISPLIYNALETRATRNLSREKSTTWFDFRYGDDCNGVRTVGEKITTVECKGGQVSVHRAHFLDELVKLLPEGIAKFGYRVVDCVDEGDKGVLLEFSNGEVASHDAVIGCDGIKSKTRYSVLGYDHPAARAVYSGKYAYRGLIAMDEARSLLGQELSENSQMYLGQHGHVLTFPIEKGKTMNGR